MSASDKARVKEAVQAYLHGKTEATVSEVLAYAAKSTGLEFGSTTIAKYMTSLGWSKCAPSIMAGAIYRAPES